MTAPRDSSEADVIFNRASLALAKSEGLISSWLPPKTSQEVAARKTEDELDEEESKKFLPVPELLGLGMPVPQDAESTLSRFGSHSSHQDYKLRRTLLGKSAFTSRNTNSMGSNPRWTETVSSKARLNETKSASDSEDEIGRTAFRGKVAKLGKWHPDPERVHIAPTGAALAKNDTAAKQGISCSAAQKKRSGTYLDEVLLQRSKKRKMKRKTS